MQIHVDDFLLGLVFETEINAAEDGRFFQASLEQYVKQVSRNYVKTGIISLE